MRLDRRPRDRPSRRGRRRRTAIRGRAPADVRRLPGARAHPGRRRRRASPPSAGRSRSTTTFEVPWTSDRITPPGRAALAGGRDRAADRRSRRHDARPRVPCPHCGSRGPSWTARSGRPSAGRSTTAATAASRSRRSSRSDRGRDRVDRSSRRRRRGRDDGRRHRPGRARGRPRGRPLRRRRGRDRARPRRGSATALTRRAARLDLDPDTIDDWVDGPPGRLARRADARRGSAPRPDLVIEAALEDLAVKRTIFRALDAATRRRRDPRHEHERAVGRGDRRARRRTRSGSLGLHFFNPAPVMPLVEVVVAPATRSAASSTRDRGSSTAWGKTPVRCADTPGLHRQPGQPAVHARGAPRCSRPATAVVEAIDAAIRAAGFPMGPFELMDLVGLDVNLAAARAVWEGLGRAAIGSGRRRSRSGSSPRAGSAARPARVLPLRGRTARRAPAPIRRRARTPSGAHADADPSTRIRVARDRRRGVPGARRRASRPRADIDLAMRLGAGHPVGPFERATSWRPDERRRSLRRTQPRRRASAGPAAPRDGRAVRGRMPRPPR